MIASLLFGSIALNVLLFVAVIALLDKRNDDAWRDEQAIAPDDRQATPQATHTAKPKPFRARKSFREARKQFEDAHDPQRMSRERVEKFAQAKE